MPVFYVKSLTMSVATKRVQTHFTALFSKDLERTIAYGASFQTTFRCAKVKKNTTENLLLFTCSMCWKLNSIIANVLMMVAAVTETSTKMSLTQ